MSHRNRFTATLLLLAASATAFAESGTDAGSKVYAQICKRCHGEDTAKLAAHVDQLAALLDPQRISAHRFYLSEQQTADLSAYLRSQQ